MAQPTPVTFYFDPLCPWAWMTSRWMTEVAQHRELALTWRVMSLRLLNEGRDLSAEYLDHLERLRDLSAAVAAAQLRDGVGVVSGMYTALGTRTHPGGRRDVEAMIEEACVDVGIAPIAISDCREQAVQDLLRAGTDELIAKVGTDVGTPTIDIDGAALFGPVVTPAPTGQAALDLWDGLVLVTRTSGFYELKRSRELDPIFS